LIKSSNGGIKIQDWLALFQKIGDEASEVAKRMYVTAEAGEKLERGAGGDITVKIDKVIEDIIIKHLKEKDNVKLISEEAGEIVFGEPETVVLADPIDGSFNAKNGIPLFAISMALAVPQNGGDVNLATVADAKLGYIMNPVSGVEYRAERGKGAFKNGNRLNIKDDDRLNTFAVELSPDAEETFKRYSRLFDANSRLRCVGSLALELCFTAENIFDCILDLRKGRCRIIDTLAGIMILEEAGGVVSDDKGNPIDHIPLNVDRAFNLVGARNEKIHKKIIDALAD
jgi:myo-inositol-1(or 4)-monophosphatase